MNDPDIQPLPYQAVFEKYGEEYGVDWRLIAAHAYVESRFSPLAKSKASCYGVLQVLCNPQDKDGTCLNDFPAIEEWPGTRVDDLYDVDINVRIATQIMAWNIRHYGMPRAIAVYNSWEDHTSPLNGPFKGQGTNDYVRNVLAKYKEYQSTYGEASA